ncbi:DUF4214 domain-containing protein [Zooshikella ganghwensis]|uniref:DUF4214 domain-containing protein n=1 Tax=Zooshikella ganghwensis TaxID=202772 RepID=A0A4P9VIA0_9GAMM|nr:DUF4214 domain-containing protein [Zooshikella ganghwensis]RDH41351.1 DUF4214 domain-containing protein [Zooshikella ganghwensis]RDH41362.1 DUF4214 domain-containing protein [Zooshikella ganghwensis]
MKHLLLVLALMPMMAFSGYPDLTKTWPSNRIAVCFEEIKPGLIAGGRNLYQEARDAVTNSWQANSGLSFYGWGKCSANAQGIRVRIVSDSPFPDQEDIILIGDSQVNALGFDINGKKAGLELYVERQCAAENEDGYDPKTCWKYVVIHEFGHALGFAHEHNRSEKHCSDKVEQGPDGSIYFGDYDRTSVMNYCSSKSRRTVSLSAGDKRMVSWIYRSYPFTNQNIIDNYYYRFTGKFPSVNDSGYVYWQGELASRGCNENTLRDIIWTFVNHGYTLDDNKARFVSAMYQAAFNRDLTAKEKDDPYWVKEMIKGATRADVAYALLHSEEFTQVSQKICGQ